MQTNRKPRSSALSKPEMISWYSYTGKFLNCLCKAFPQTEVHPQKVPLAAVIANKLRILPAQLCQILLAFFFSYTYIGKALKYRPDLCLFLPKNKMNSLYFAYALQKSYLSCSAVVT